MKINSIILHMFISIFLLSFLFQSCSSVILISDYDEITDKMTNVIQEKVSVFFIKMERDIGMDSANYEYYISFYDDAKVDLGGFILRYNFQT